MTPLRRNILIFHQGALGDFVLTWPIAVALARIHPQSRVFYVTHAQKGKLAEKVLGVESADADAGWHSLFGEGGALPDKSGRLLAGAHSVISFLSASDSPFVQNVRSLAPDANVLTIDPNPPEDFAGHVSEFQLKQLGSWPALHSAAEQILRSVHARGITGARPAHSADVAIHPGSGSPSKNWPVERYFELVQRLHDRGEHVRVILGEVEIDRWPKDVIERLGSSSRVVQPATYVDLMSELQSARVLIGNDSGSSHLAAMLGVPTVALFGPTDPVRWKPIGPSVKTLHADPLESLDVDRVLNAL